MTIHLVQADTLAKFRYLENGAYYAIGILAILILVSASHEVSEMATGLIGALIIGAALIDSEGLNKAAN